MNIAQRFSRLADWMKYGILNAVIGVMIGVHITMTFSGNEYYVYIFAAPLAIFLTGGILWKTSIGTERPTDTKIIYLGLLTGSISHYFTFLFLSILMNIGYWCFGAFADSFGGPPASILDLIGGSFFLSLASLFMYGWITVPASLLIAFFINSLKDKSSNRNDSMNENLNP